MRSSRKYYFNSMSFRTITPDKSFISKLIASACRLHVRSAWISGAVVLFVFALTGGPLAAVLKPGQGSPVASVDQSTHDFGEVYEGEHISHTFTVRNNGSAPLELRDPGARAQNTAGERSGFFAAAVPNERGRAVLALPAAFSTTSFAGHGERRGAASLLSPAGRRAAPS